MLHMERMIQDALRQCRLAGQRIHPQTPQLGLRHRLAAILRMLAAKLEPPTDSPTPQRYAPL